MDKRYFEESYIFIEWKGGNGVLYWKMSNRKKEMFFMKILSDDRRKKLENGKHKLNVI